MSASNKKKLRHAENVAKLTERQVKEQAEAKKLNLYTTLFVVVLAVLLVAAVTVGVVKSVQGNGIRERSTTALTVNEQKLNNVELNYYYVDAINNFLSNYGSYASLFGLDTTLPLDQQVVNAETGLTWADDFLNTAKNNAKAVYAMVDAAEADGYTLTAEEEAQVDAVVQNMEAYALLYGFADTKTYLQAMYGNGATVDSYKEYCRASILADSYYNNYAASLTYEEAELRAFEAEDPKVYNSYSYNYYYLSASVFLEGGTTDEEGNTTYSDEEKAAALVAAEIAAKSLTADTIDSVEALETALNNLSIFEDSTVSTISCEDYLYSSVMTVLSDWVTDEARQEGDLTYIPTTSTSTDEDGNEVVTTNGYYVVFFRGSSDNIFPLVNARHILVAYEGGTYDSNTGVTTYTDEEKAAARTEAEELLAQWKAGEATEDSFAALANENTDDTASSTNGGLYTEIYPGKMVASFEDWVYADRKAGDVELVESDHGVHIIYFVGESETNYRDFMIKTQMMSNDTSEWYNALLEATTVVDGDTQYINKGLIISSN